jgi:hypothetical protein
MDKYDFYQILSSLPSTGSEKNHRLLWSKLLAKPGYESRTFKIQVTELRFLNTKKMTGKPF